MTNELHHVLNVVHIVGAFPCWFVRACESTVWSRFLFCDLSKSYVVSVHSVIGTVFIVCMYTPVFSCVFIVDIMYGRLWWTVDPPSVLSHLTSLRVMFCMHVRDAFSAWSVAMGVREWSSSRSSSVLSLGWWACLETVTWFRYCFSGDDSATRQVIRPDGQVAPTWNWAQRILSNKNSQYDWSMIGH